MALTNLNPVQISLVVSVGTQSFKRNKLAGSKPFFCHIRTVYWPVAPDHPSPSLILHSLDPLQEFAEVNEFSSQGDVILILGIYK
jgi:hypothetical protein